MNSINSIINDAKGQLGNVVEEIIAIPIDDDDLNHRIELRLGNQNVPASLFSLKENGKDKEHQVLVQELVTKVKNHLQNLQNSNLVHLSSGAMIENKTDVRITEVNGYFTIDGKVVVIKTENGFIPLPGHMVQTYTILKAFKEPPLLIIKDEFDETKRDDKKEGFIFDLRKPITLTKEEIRHHPKDIVKGSFPEKAEYFILYRKRSDVN